MDSQPIPEAPVSEAEARYQAAVALLGRPTPAEPLWWKVSVLVAIAAAAAGLALVPQGGAAWAAALTSAMLLHELGHWIALRLLGFRDDSVFFLPFLNFGLPANTAPASLLQRGIALLAGPLPGLALALALQASYHPSLESPLAPWVGSLLVFNGVNLLPFGGLDAGRLVTLFSAHRRVALTAACFLLAALALGALAWAGGAWIAAALALFLLLAALTQVLEWRRFPTPLAEMPADLGSLDEPTRRALYVRADEEDPEAAAAAMRGLHQLASSPKPTARGWLLMSALHAAGIFIACLTLLLAAHDHEAAAAALTGRYDAWAAGQLSWDELVDKWKAAPRPLQERALGRLAKRWLANPRRERGVMALSSALGIPLSVS
jgi:hypothetical protein